MLRRLVPALSPDVASEDVALPPPVLVNAASDVAPLPPGRGGGGTWIDDIIAELVAVVAELTGLTAGPPPLGNPTTIVS
jgi:hypothetical protein